MKLFILTALTVCSLVSARAAVFEYEVNCTGPKESPVNASPGVGIGTVVYDDVAHTLQMQVSFSGLEGNVTQTHIHALTTAPFFQNSGIAVGNTSLPGFPLGVKSGVYSNTLDLTSTAIYNPAFLSNNGGTAAGAEAALAAALVANRAYWNIHTSSYPGGEIRDFPAPQIRIINMAISSNLAITSTIASTNNRTFIPEFITNLFTTNWTALTVQSNRFVNGTNEIFCGTPPVNVAFVRIRAQVN